MSKMRCLFILLVMMSSACGDVEKIDGTITMGNKRLTCSFTFVFIGEKVNLKKSKVTACLPKPKKTVTFNHQKIISEAGHHFSFNVQVKKSGIGKLKEAIVQLINIKTTTKTTTMTSTLPPTQSCTSGYTLVCGEASTTVGNMTTVCPANQQEQEGVEEKCSCFSTWVVEQALSSGVSPLGSKFLGCVKVSTDLVFKDMDKFNMTLQADDWKIDEFVSNLIARSGRQRKDQMKQKLMQAMDQTIEHEQRIKSKGRSSRFIRSTRESDAIAHNYAIMRSLQIAAGTDTDSLSVRTGLNVFQETCQELNANITKQSECDSTECDSKTSYRTISGCCNNLENKSFGSAFRAFNRLTVNAYEDSVSIPRGGFNSSILPSPRAVSSAVHRVKETGSTPSVSVMLMQFGQFLDHDMTRTPEKDLHCCNSKVLEEDLKMSEMSETLRSCFNINFERDNFYSGKTQCLPFTRSDPICTTSNTREQFNAITAYIDGSNVYGSDEETSKRLRKETNGEMRTHETGPTLPTRRQCGFNDDDDDPHHPEDLVGGDTRSIEQPGLASIHSLFINEHNRISGMIKEEKPEMEDEELYQVTRRLVGAQLQNIVYSEFLPLVLGQEVMSRYNLNLPIEMEDSSTYDPRVDSTIANEFATVAYRFGHSLIPNILHLSNNPIRTSRQSCPLKENFNEFEEFVIGSDFSGKSWQNTLVGITTQQSPAMDSSINKNLVDFLFCGENCGIRSGFGQDLAARNIQRGRDHGLPAYVKFREFCGLTEIKNWDSKPDEISKHNWENLRSVYTTVEDIDPFSGGLSEKPGDDGLVGPTFACIIGLQFEKAKAGDRFFFTHPDNGAQSEKGLPAKIKAKIRNRRLSDILCDNTGIASITADVMKMSDKEENCSEKHQLNFEDVKELFEEASAKMIFFGPGRILHASNFSQATGCTVPPYPLNIQGFLVHGLLGSVTAVVDNTIWYCGGHVGGTSGLIFQNSCYQLSEGAWVQQASLTTGRSRSAGSVTSSGEWLITGGYDGNNRLASTELLSGGTWQAGPTLQEAVERHCQVTIGDTVYVIGGYTDSATNHVYSWSTGDTTWTRVADMPTARYGTSCTVYGEDILVLGGSRVYTVERYQPRYDTWSVLPSLPVLASSYSSYSQAGTVGGVVWAFSLADGSIYTTTDTVQWNKTVFSGFTGLGGGAQQIREVFPAPLVTPDMMNC